MDRVEFAKVMAILVAGTGAQKPSGEQLDVYFELLKDLPIAVLQTAATRALVNHKYPTLPPIGLIRQQAAELTESLPSPIADAWSSVREFAARWEYWLLEGMPTDEKTLGRYRAHRARLDPIALRAAESYGWSAIIGTEPGVAFAHFRQLYESLDRPARQEAALPAPLKTPIRAPAVESLVAKIGRVAIAASQPSEN